MLFVGLVAVDLMDIVRKYLLRLSRRRVNVPPMCFPGMLVVVRPCLLKSMTPDPWQQGMPEVLFVVLVAVNLIKIVRKLRRRKY